MTTTPWKLFDSLPVGGTVIVEHDHVARTSGGRTLKCARNQTISANQKAHRLSLHVFHDDRNRLWVVRTA